MSDKDKELIQAFEDLSLGLDRWDQRTHVSIAFLYLRELGFNDALEELRKRIKAFNAHNQIEETATSGYNETTTVALLQLIHSVMISYGKVFPVESADDFCDTHPQLMSKHVLRFFYSPEQRIHVDAKSQFIEPDLASLPEVR